ncbi:MAG: hypothetical protein OEV62_02770 [Actinomycetota bacterium]|nr:hypothetical protein [Actinomycetota bacterium]MDH4353730.1 hypothetical protein [Actinomycetota bacterium]
MSDRDLHAELDTAPDDDLAAELEDPEVPVADAAEQAAPVTEPEPDHETLPLDDDEYR